MSASLLLWSLLALSGSGAPGARAAEVSTSATFPAAEVATLTTTLAAEPTDASQERYEVYLLTMDQGAEVWERFGHNALLIRDHLTGQELAWNWGLFDFAEVDFIPRFLRGTMLYSMGPAELEPFVAAYARANRTVHANRIHLTQEEAEELDTFVRWNFEPENRAYVYHYYLDNCSTRVRDALDRVLDGLLRETFFDRETPRSFRWHSRRLVQETLWIDQGLSFLLGTRGDVPRTEWQAMFVPMELLESLETVERADPEGGTRPLLGPRVTLFESTRPPAPASPPDFSLIWLLAGFAGAGAVAGLGAAFRRGMKPARPALAGLLLGWGVLSGLLGFLLVLAWFTDHGFIQWNLNLLHMNPLGLVLAGALGVAALRPGGWSGAAGRIARGLALAIAGISLATLLLQATPFLHQGNAEVLAVAVPMNLAVAWALARATGWSSPEHPRGQPGSEARDSSSA